MDDRPGADLTPADIYAWLLYMRAELDAIWALLEPKGM